jgi:hypothetical protein
MFSNNLVRAIRNVVPRGERFKNAAYAAMLQALMSGLSLRRWNGTRASHFARVSFYPADLNAIALERPISEIPTLGQQPSCPALFALLVVVIVCGLGHRFMLGLLHGLWKGYSPIGSLGEVA